MGLPLLCNGSARIQSLYVLIPTEAARHSGMMSPTIPI